MAKNNLFYKSSAMGHPPAASLGVCLLSGLLALNNSEFFGSESVCGAPIVNTEACEPAGKKSVGLRPQPDAHALQGSRWDWKRKKKKKNKQSDWVTSSLAAVTASLTWGFFFSHPSTSSSCETSSAGFRCPCLLIYNSMLDKKGWAEALKGLETAAAHTCIFRTDTFKISVRNSSAAL